MRDRLLQLFRGQDPLAVVIEMAVIWLGVFLVLRFLQGTRGAGVFKGLIVLVAALFLALRVVGLFSDSFARLRFLSEGLLGALAIFLLVVFQPELRQGMVRLGQTAAFHPARRRRDRTLDAVAEAVEFLSRNTFGAVIVIERTVPLGGLAANGVPIDAVVGARLLESIFWPSSPLHDLAVVIRGDRIAAACVQLPLADEGVGHRLGSRHRAAVGTTVETDALVVVVSEETGSIRLAEKGRLSDEIKPDDLESVLRRHLQPAAQQASSSLLNRLGRFGGRTPARPGDRDHADETNGAEHALPPAHAEDAVVRRG